MLRRPKHSKIEVVAPEEEEEEEEEKMLNRAGRIVYSNEAGEYASSSIATCQVIQAGQISAKNLDKQCTTTRG
jgi:hypothetical protein